MQTRDIDYSHIEINVDATVSSVSKLIETPGKHFKQMNDFMKDEVEKVATLIVTDADKENFMKTVRLC